MLGVNDGTVPSPPPPPAIIATPEPRLTDDFMNITYALHGVIPAHSASCACMLTRDGV